MSHYVHFLPINIHALCTLVFTEEMQQFLDYVNKLGYTDTPDYNKCRQIFKNAMKKNGYTDDKLQLQSSASPVKVNMAKFGIKLPQLPSKKEALASSLENMPPLVPISRCGRLSKILSI